MRREFDHGLNSMHYQLVVTIRGRFQLVDVSRRTVHAFRGKDGR